jgi:RNA polymerase sigma-70 factor (ECF subfamily)
VHEAHPSDDDRRQEIETWIRQAKEGCPEARGRLLEACNEFLRGAAGHMVSAELRAKCAPSDLVQETALDAHRDFGQFQGERLEELFAWLRKILLDNAITARRRYEQAAKRQVSREISLEASQAIAGALRDDAPSPRSVLGRLEKQRQVESALDRLPPDHKQAILLRSRDHLSFAEIGARLGRSEDAARKLWFRAIERLRRELSTGHERN